MFKLTYLIVFFSSAFFIPIKAQNITDSAVNIILEKQLKIVENLTDSFLYNPIGYINGELYYSGGTVVEHPYFQSNSWFKGTVDFEGSRYPVQMMKYDAEKDIVVVMQIFNNLGYPIQLKKVHIPGFTIDGHHFVYVDREKDAGYYEVLYDSDIKLYVRHKKTNENVIEGIPHYSSKESFFILKNSDFHEVRNLRQLYSLFPDKEGELKMFRKKNHLSFRKNKQGTIIQLLTQYDRLQD